MEAGENQGMIELPIACDRAALGPREPERQGFLQIRLEVDASEPHLKFTLEGPPGTKRVLDVEFELMLGPRNP